MKKLFLIVTILFCAGTLFAQQDAKERLGIALNENAKLKILLESEQDKYRKAIIKHAVLVGQLDGINKGIDKATALLQKGYDFGKLNYKELFDCGFRLSIDTSSVYQRPSKDKKPKKK